MAMKQIDILLERQDVRTKPFRHCQPARSEAAPTSSLKLLVVGHSYVTAFAQNKYVAMKQLHGDLQLRLVVPREVPHMFSRYKCGVAPGMDPQEVVPIRGIFHSHMTYVLDPVRLAGLLKKFQPDHIHIEEDPHSLIGVETVFLARLACPHAKISFFIWDNVAHQPQFLLRTLKWAFTKFSLSRSSMVVCGSDEAEHLLKEHKRYSGATFVLPQVGLNPEEYSSAPPAELTKQLRSTGDALLVGYMGRLVPEKGVILLLEALSRLRHLSWKVLVVGSGPLQHEIQTRWKSLLNDRLIFLGAIPHTEVPDYLKCLDIFVLPSCSTPFWKEQFGLTLAQAMMAGVACVGSSCGAIPEVLGPGGIVFPEGDVEGLANALRTMIESKDTRDRFGNEGRAFAHQRYTNHAVAQAYLHAFVKTREKNEKENAEEHSCPACRSRSCRPLLSGGEDLLHGCPGSWSIVECNDCHLFYTVPHLSKEELLQYYPAEYASYNLGAKGLRDNLVGGLLRRAVMSPYWLRYGAPEFEVPPFGQSTLLEIGCGAGLFLKKMAARGWKCSGIDISPVAVERTKKNAPDADVAQSSLADLSTEKRFEMIVMSQVLEHLPDPVESLRKCFELLSPGGKLWIGIPNIGSFEARVFGKYWSGLDLPRHMVHFREPVARRLLERCGFSVVHIRPAMFASSISESLIRLLPRRVRTPIHSRLARCLYLLTVFPAALSYLFGNRGIIEIVAERPA